MPTQDLLPEVDVPLMVDRQVLCGVGYGAASVGLVWIAFTVTPLWLPVFAAICYLVGTYAMLRSWMELQDVLRMGYEPLGPVDSLHGDDASRTMVGN
jgi:hypothetical protein